MTAKGQVYIWAVLLSCLGIGMISYKHLAMGVPLTPGEKRDVWVVESVIEFTAHGDPVKIKTRSPGYFSNFELMDQTGASPGYGYSNTFEEPYYINTWTAREVEGSQKIYYNFSMFEYGELKKAVSGRKREFKKPHFEASQKTAAKSVINAAWQKSADQESFVKDIIRRMQSTTPTQNVSLLKTSLSDEYKMIHLIRDLLLLKDVKSSVVKGLKLEDGHRRMSPDLYLAILNDEWSIVNHVTGDFKMPDRVIFWGVEPILEVEGASNSKITYSMIKSQESAKFLAIKKNLAEGSPLISFSIYSLPLEFQTLFKMLLLIPVGTLIVVVIRNLVGLSTSGTFMPVLLAIAFIETTLVKGVIILLLILMLGLLIRFYLSRMNLLLVPRISAVVICVVLLMAGISIVTFKLGFHDGVSVTLFPMIIISWTIERASILWEEHGGHEVLVKMGGSLVVSILVYAVMTNSFVKYFTFAFPECMMILLALVLLIGVYTGYRLTELYRFEPLVKKEDLDK